MNLFHILMVVTAVNQLHSVNLGQTLLQLHYCFLIKTINMLAVIKRQGNNRVASFSLSVTDYLMSLSFCYLFEYAMLQRCAITNQFFIQLQLFSDFHDFET